MAEDTSTFGSRLKAFISKEKTNAKAEKVASRIQELTGQEVSDEFKKVLRQRGVADQASTFFESERLKGLLESKTKEITLPQRITEASEITKAQKTAELDPAIVGLEENKTRRIETAKGEGFSSPTIEGIIQKILELVAKTV